MQKVYRRHNSKDPYSMEQKDENTFQYFDYSHRPITDEGHALNICDWLLRVAPDSFAGKFILPSDINEDDLSAKLKCCAQDTGVQSELQGKGIKSLQLKEKTVILFEGDKSIKLGL